jgi:vacuolar protein sorting-associated protein 16
MRDFDGLDAFSKSKRSSPIGYEVFVRHLIEKGHSKEAVSYVSRCDGPKRIDLYVDCGDWRMAGKECKERGNKARLECVFLLLLWRCDFYCLLLSFSKLRKSCPDSLITRELDQVYSTMK